MDSMEHKEYIRKGADATRVVLFIHGILGSPKHFKDLIPQVPKEMDVYAILLDGHGKTVKDFSTTSMEKWRSQAMKAISELTEAYEEVYIVAHSMGTLFAIRGGVTYPERIKGLFLIASPVRLFIKPEIAVTTLRVGFGNMEKYQNKPRVLAADEAYSVERDRRFWIYFAWIPRFLELFSEIRKTRKLIGSLKVPTTVYQSRHDEMVACSSKKCFDCCELAEVTFLESSAHFYYDKDDLSFMISEFKQFLG